MCGFQISHFAFRISCKRAWPWPWPWPDEERETKERRRRQVTSPKKGHMHGVIPISQRGRQERGQGHVREGDGDGDGDGHSERGSCAYAWRKGKGQKSPRGRRDAFWVLDGTRCAEMGDVRRPEEARRRRWKIRGKNMERRQSVRSRERARGQKQKQVKSAITAWRAEEESPRSGRVQKKCTQ